MTHWREQRERGGLLWLSALGLATRIMGRPLLRVLCAPIALVFLLSASDARRHSQAYLARVLPVQPRWWHTLRHFYCFALVSCDRLLFLSGKWHKFDLDIEDQELILEHARAGRGCLLLVSHLGSFDAMRVPAVELDKIKLRIVIDKQHSPAAMQVIEKLNPTLAADMLDAAAPATTLALTVHEALQAGEMVGIMADRAARHETVAPVSLLGGQAHLPTGPWLLGRALKAPIFVCLALYRGGNRYRIRFHQLSDGSAVPRAERRQQVAENMQQYAAILEENARAYPYNWFNFYDFWSIETAQDH